MRSKISLVFCLMILAVSCRQVEKKISIVKKGDIEISTPAPIDKGFTNYITSYTSGIVQADAVVEIHFTPEFSEVLEKEVNGIFSFEPAIRGKAEWKDESTLIFIPAKPLDGGKIYSGTLNLAKLAKVEERLSYFPIRIQTLKKDFRIVIGTLESNPEATSYDITGQIITSDIIDSIEVESYLTVAMGRKKAELSWDHTKKLIHDFTIQNIERGKDTRELRFSWDGTGKGVSQKGESLLLIPGIGEFVISDFTEATSESQKIDIIFSDPLDETQEITGIVHFSPEIETEFSISSNKLTIIPVGTATGNIELVVESALRNFKGKTLESRSSRQINFDPVMPGIMAEGNGIIVPASENLIFPFKTANLKAVDLTIIKMFANNLPYFLQENDLNGGYSMKRFGRPVYSGRVDLPANNNPGSWTLQTIDLADYIKVEPGVLYKVNIGMRKSYSLYQCNEQEEEGNYEEILRKAEEENSKHWDDPDYYYEDAAELAYYEQSDFNWSDRDNPCKNAYYSPDKRIKRNLMASNLGIIAKMGEDNIMHVAVNDLISAFPVKEASVEIYDYQLQIINKGITDQEGAIALPCERKPFLVIAEKDKDRNYLKTNEGNSLSLSSFDVSGTRPENGIKAFIYGERDVWRPGDSIYLSVFIKDMKASLPPDHPVQFELFNPSEQKIDNQVIKASGSNLIVFRTSTPSDAVTGNYNAVVRIGGASFSKRVRVETIKPNRLKLTLDFPGKVLENNVEGKLNVKWLNGSVAGNLESSIEYLLKPSVTKFEGYSQYIFDDPVNTYEPLTVSMFNSSLDDNGEAQIVFNPENGSGAPGMMNAIFTVKAMEPGGDESIIQTSYKYAPYPVFAGLNFPDIDGRMMFTDRENRINLATVNSKGKPVDSDVEITVYKLSYRWWWEGDDENLGYYISDNYHEPVLKKTVETSSGKASFTINIPKEEWGRYLVRATTPEGHSTGKIVLIDWPWEYGAKSGTDGATLLALSIDKEKYTPGDEIRLSFPSPENARAIITLENSTGVLEEIRTNTTKGNTEVKIKVKPSMSPNVYAYVSVIQPHVQTINDMPVRLYGVIPVIVEDPGTRLEPVLNMPDELRSAKPFVASVKERSGKPMTYTLAIVDEGLLDITGFKTPDPWNYFFAREALGVRTWDLYDYVLGAFGGTLDRLLATGGDEAVTDKSAGKVQRFIPVVKFVGPFNLQPGKSNSHSITLPQYTGSVRAMVIAGNDGAYGISEKTIPVRDPLMVLATAPRVLTPGDKVTLPVTLFVQKKGISEVKIEAKSSSELITFENSAITVPTRETGETDVQFSFKTGNRMGSATISITASGGGETAVQTIQLEIRSPNPAETRAETRILKKGEKWNAGFNTFGLEGTNSAVIEVSGMPSINLEKRLSYLTGYPHGCSEQVTSTAFPQLYIGKLVKTDDAAKRSKNIKEAVSTIVSRQMANGGVAMWPGSLQADNWITSYTGHFMIEAERSGYSIPSSFRRKWLNYQTKLAREWKTDLKYRQTQNDQAYRLFTLALAGEPEKGAMNRLRESKELTSLSKWFLAGAYALSGRPEAANGLLDMRNISTEPEYQDYYYGSALRDKAIILYALTLLKNEEQGLGILRQVCENFSSNEWYSTQTTAWGLFAYSKWIEMMPETEGKQEVQISVNGQDKKVEIPSKQLMKEKPDIKTGTNTLEVSNSGEGTVYVTVVKKGIPGSGDETAAGKGLTLKVAYYDLKMNPVDPKNIKQGTDFLTVTTVSNISLSNIYNIALTQMAPSGWEIRNTRLFEAETGIKESQADYRDFRDDRINTYFNLGTGETKTFVSMITAAYTGEFHLPALWCEAMYSPGIFARIPGAEVKVEK
ncbi:MAG TPA: MG2 domain-containing protein [Bacteroidales bacterium]|nr:MG2 domain-containing protein [Bacteroidales bacterium]